MCNFAVENKRDMDTNEKEIMRKRFHSFIKKVIEDKEALNKCIREGGDIDEVARERGIRFV